MVLASWPEGMPPSATWLWAPTTPITVPANLNIAGSVKCYGPRPRITVPVNHSNACLLREICDLTSPVMYLIDTDYVIRMPSVISYYASNVNYMYNDHEHDRISFTCAY